MLDTTSAKENEMTWTTTALDTADCHTCGATIQHYPSTNEWMDESGESHGLGAEVAGSTNTHKNHNPQRHWHAPKAQPPTTVTLTREQLLDLLTTAASIGYAMDSAKTRGDLTANLLTYPSMRDALPASA